MRKMTIKWKSSSFILSGFHFHFEQSEISLCLQTNKKPATVLCMQAEDLSLLG